MLVTGRENTLLLNPEDDLALGIVDSCSAHSTPVVQIEIIEESPALYI